MSFGWEINLFSNIWFKMCSQRTSIGSVVNYWVANFGFWLGLGKIEWPFSKVITVLPCLSSNTARLTCRNCHGDCGTLFLTTHLKPNQFCYLLKKVLTDKKILSYSCSHFANHCASHFRTPLLLANTRHSSLITDDSLLTSANHCLSPTVASTSWSRYIHYSFFSFLLFTFFLLCFFFLFLFSSFRLSFLF